MFVATIHRRLGVERLDVLGWPDSPMIVATRSR
jgi:hypothetical protein